MQEFKRSLHIESVSYTHLDVYKRQVYMIPLFIEENVLGILDTYAGLILSLIHI